MKIAVILPVGVDASVERSAVTNDHRLREAGQLGQLAAPDMLTKIISGGRPSGSQYESGVELSDLEAFQYGGCGKLGEGVRIGWQAIVGHGRNSSCEERGPSRDGLAGGDQMPMRRDTRKSSSDGKCAILLS